MKRRKPEKLNSPVASQDFSLEEIIQEFGGTAAEPLTGDTAKFTPVRESEKPKFSDTMPLPDLSLLKAEDLKGKKKPDGKKAEPNKRIAAKLPKLQFSALLLSERDGKTDSMRIRLFLLALLALLAIPLLFHNSFPTQILPFSERYFLPVCCGLLLAALLVSRETLFAFCKDLLHLRLTGFSLCVAAVALSVTVAIVYDRPGFCPVCVFALLYTQRARHAEHSALGATLRAVVSFASPMGIYDAPQLLENTDSLRRDTGNPDDFLDKLTKRNAISLTERIYASAVLPLSAGLGYLLAYQTGEPFLLCWLLLLIGALPLSLSASLYRPFAFFAKRLSGFGGALCGWHGARIFGGRHTIILRDEDLFPKDSLSFNGMKLYGSSKAGRIISYALCALEVAESPLCNLFETALQAQLAKRSFADASRIYDDGIGVEIGNDVVLVGTLSFMRAMGVDMPEGTRVRQAVYVSVNGELAGIFAVKYKPNNSTRTGLRDILSNRNFSVVMATRDFLLTPELIAAKYELATDAIAFPPLAERIRLSDADPNDTAEQGALIAKDTFRAFACTIAAGRKLRIVCLLNLSLALFSGLLGFTLCALCIHWGAFSAAAPLYLIAYQLLWTAISALLSAITVRL